MCPSPPLVPAHVLMPLFVFFPQSNPRKQARRKRTGATATPADDHRRPRKQLSPPRPPSSSSRRAAPRRLLHASGGSPEHRPRPRQSRHAVVLFRSGENCCQVMAIHPPPSDLVYTVPIRSLKPEPVPLDLTRQIWISRPRSDLAEPSLAEPSRSSSQAVSRSQFLNFNSE